jgi:hypothetical protein
MDSVAASDVIASDRIFCSSNLYSLGFVLAARFLCVWLAQDFSLYSPSTFAGFTGSSNHRRGGDFMQLKVWVLSGSAIALWLVPLATLDKNISWHKSIQGLSLVAAVSCALGAGNIAGKLSDEDEIEAIKTRAIKADIVDEIATSAYVSQGQRQQEAEAILNPVEHLERALALKYGGKNELAPERSNQLAEPEQNGSQNEESERAERALQLKAKGWGKAKIILELWGVTKGGSPKYKAVEAEYMAIVAQAEGRESV